MKIEVTIKEVDEEYDLDMARVKVTYPALIYSRDMNQEDKDAFMYELISVLELYELTKKGEVNNG